MSGTTTSEVQFDFQTLLLSHMDLGQAFTKQAPDGKRLVSLYIYFILFIIDVIFASGIFSLERLQIENSIKPGFSSLRGQGHFHFVKGTPIENLFVENF